MQNVKEDNGKLVIDCWKHLSLAGIESVDGFGDDFLKLSVNGAVLNILGSGIKITSYNKLSGTLTADGAFTTVKYGAGKGGVLKKVFK